MKPVLFIGSGGMESTECGKRIRAARAYADLSQKELAEKLGIGRNTLLAMENGRHRVRDGTLWEISRICKVPLWLLTADWIPREVRGPDDNPWNDERPPRSAGRER